MSGFLASIPTWDVMLCAAGFCFLIVCLVPCRLIHAAWREAFLMVLYVFMATAIIAGFVYGMGWVAPPAGFVHDASEVVSALTGAETETIRPWVVLATTAAAVLGILVVIQVIGFAGRVRMFSRLLGRLNDSCDTDATDPPVRVTSSSKPAPRDDVQTARDGLGALLHRPNPGKQSLHKWLQG